MRHHHLTALTLLAGAALSGTYALANSPTASATSDTTRLYPEELQRRRIIRETKVISVGGNVEAEDGRDSIETLLERFYVNQFRNSQDPHAPYFTFMSRDANMAMGIGGLIRVRGWMDWNGMIDNASFCTYLIQMPKTPETMKSLGASVAGTTLFFNIMGRHSRIGDYQAYIEGGFNGYANSGFKLKKAWVQIEDWTVGYSHSTFSDPAAQPDLLDGAGANGKIDKTNVLLRYMHTWKDRWTVAGSVEFPSSAPQEQEGQTKKVKDYTPDIAALGQIQWDRGLSHVRVAAVLRNMAYRDLISERNRHVIGWGVQLSSVVKATRWLTFYGITSVGQGVGSYTGDLSAGKYDLISNLEKPGRLYAPTTLTGTAGVKFNYLPDLSTTVALATMRTFKEGLIDGDTYKYGQYLAANLIYNITPRLQIGVEYLAGKRMNYSGEHGNVNRAEAVFSASF